MKKIRTLIAIIISLLLTSLLLSGCESVLVSRRGDKGTGEIETRQFTVTEFTSVDIGSAFSYEIGQADTYSVSITANSNMFEELKVAKVGQTLKIEREKVSRPLAPLALFDRDSERPKAIINMPQLTSLYSSGATSGAVYGFSSMEDLDIRVSGASSLEVEEMTTGSMYLNISGASSVIGVLESEDMDVYISGASSIQLEGSAGDISIQASGASTVRLADLTVNDADVVLSGASVCTLRLNGKKLDADLSGASTLDYSGEPMTGIIKTSGASVLNKKSSDML